eukprot:TRINITY_DN12670_c0_g1_i1.p1 TRINITY_DN12670_c0_g1~~TRINITY_DN12670_c0_g1_i1.p1  ORF type:complete len:828 (+),score=244.36 TRINITY_DN12670_c0_g1_i1:49-2484(+)
MESSLRDDLEKVLSPTRFNERLGHYSVRSMKTGHVVSVMKRFEAFVERKGDTFNAKRGFRKAAHAITALKRLGLKRDLRPDMVVITGHQGGLLQIRNFDTDEVVASGTHFNNSTVTCLVATNTYIYTAVEKSPKYTSDDHCDVYVWDMTDMTSMKHTLRGHTDRVCCIAVPKWREHSPVTGSVDKTLIIWDITQGRKPVHVLHGHQMMVRHILLTPSFIISGSSDASLRVWDWDGAQRDTVETGHSGPIQCMMFGMDTTTIITACGGGTTRESGIGRDGILSALWYSKPTKAQVLSVAFDEEYVISSSSDMGNVHFYVRGKKSTHTFLLGNQAVRTLEMDPLRKCLLTGTDEGVIQAWCYKKIGEQDAQPTLLISIRGHQASISSIILDTDHMGKWERLFTASEDNTILVVDLVVDRGSRTMQAKGDIGNLTAVQPTGTLVTTSGSTFDLWNLVAQKNKQEYNETSEVLNVHKETVTGVAFSDEYMKLITVGQEGVMHLWDISLYDEEGYGHEELFTKEAQHDLRGGAVCLSDTFQETIAVGMTKVHHGIIEVMNFITGDEIAHFSTPVEPAKINLICDEGVSMVLSLLVSGDLLLHDLAGVLVSTIATDVKLPYEKWCDDSYNPPHSMVVTCQGNLVKEHRIILTGAKTLHEVKTAWRARTDSDVTCFTLLLQRGMHCIVGTTAGDFIVFNKKGENTHTIFSDGGTRHIGAPSRGRRESYANETRPTLPVAASAVSCNLSGRYIAMGYTDGIVTLWDTTSARTIQRFNAFETTVTQVITFPKLRRMVSVSGSTLRIDPLHERDDRIPVDN